MIAEGGAAVAVNFELVSATWIICLWSFTGTRAFKGDKFMASFMNYKAANLALESLFSNPPNEIRAVAAEGRLLKESGRELVTLDLVH